MAVGEDEPTLRVDHEAGRVARARVIAVERSHVIRADDDNRRERALERVFPLRETGRVGCADSNRGTGGRALT